MSMRHRYKNPPIEEALCEFRFQSGTSWDLTIPGKLQAALGDEYTGKPREQRTLELGVALHDGKTANPSYPAGVTRVQLVAKDGKRMVGVSPNILTVHMLRPYQLASPEDQIGWSAFAPRLSAALEAYIQVLAAPNVDRLGVRYINEIVIPSTTVTVDEYLKCALIEIDGLPENYSNFMGRTAYIHYASTRLVLFYGLSDISYSNVESLLDLHVIRLQHGAPLECEASLATANKLHDRANSAFEALVTDKARELFNAD